MSKSKKTPKGDGKKKVKMPKSKKQKKALKNQAAQNDKIIELLESIDGRLDSIDTELSDTSYEIWTAQNDMLKATRSIRGRMNKPINVRDSAAAIQLLNMQTMMNVWYNHLNKSRIPKVK